MKKSLVLLFIAGSIVALSGCVDHENVYDPNYERPHNTFDFSTVTKTAVSVSYANTCMGNKVYFEIYDQNPMITPEDGAPYLNTKLSPLYSGFTDEQGTFSAQMDLPAYLKKAYVYSPYFYAQTIIEGTCSNGSLSANDVDWESRVASRAKTRAGSDNDHLYFTKAVDKSKYGDGNSSDGWLQKLGEYDQSNGRITGFWEIGETTVTYETRLVSSKDNNYKLSNWYGVYYYYDNGNHYVYKFYDKNGNEGYSYPNSKYFYYYRSIPITTTGESVRHPGYNYVWNGEGTSLSLTKDEATALYKAHTAVINIKKACPTDYRASRDMYVNENNTQLTITMLGGNTCWNSTLGYYYYYGDDKPTSYGQLKGKIILLFPNTQDGLWTAGNASGYAGVDRGTAVQLKFFGYDMQGEGTTEFPAGCRVGFVLATNCWSNRISGFTGDKSYRAATTSGVSVTKDGNPFQASGTGTQDPRRAAIYKVNSNVVVSFEYYQDDQNYSDVVFAVKSDKELTDIPVVKGSYTENIVTKGVYAFEDMWPQAGDYDLNDVVVRYRDVRTLYTRVVGGVAENTSLVAETFELKTFQNYATLVNGLAFKISKYADKSRISPDSVVYSKKLPGETTFKTYDDILMTSKWKNYSRQYASSYGQPNNLALPVDSVYLLTDNIANIKNKTGFLGDSPDPIGTTYRLTIKYTRDSKGDGIDASSTSTINPFVTRVHNEEYDGTGGKYDYRLEIHVPYEAPSLTSGMVDNDDNCWARLHLWGQYDDASKPFRTDNSNQNFYLRQQTTLNGVQAGNYPFAFFLSGFGTTDSDITSMKLIQSEYEGQKISDVYSRYVNWVKSNGTSDTDWYKE